MQQLADWLEKLGMSEYAQRFAENRIDLSVLPDLTDQHLKDLGVALGDRLKLLRANGELTGASPHLSSPQLPNRRSKTLPRQGPGSCAPPPALPASGAIRASGMRLASFSLQSTAGSPRASTRSI